MDTAPLLGYLSENTDGDRYAVFDWADLTVNGTKYTSDADMPAGTQYEASNTFVRIGYIPLREGQNAITFTY